MKMLKSPLAKAVDYDPRKILIRENYIHVTGFFYILANVNFAKDEIHVLV